MTSTSISVSVVRYDSKQRRVWVGSQRLHHGSIGVVLTLVGLALVVHDRHDARWWFAFGDAQAVIERALSTTE